jgi:hypothetical protein
MKRIVMLKDDRGSEERSGVTKDYPKGSEHTVSDELAKCFVSTESCKVLGDPDVDELLGATAPGGTKAEQKTKLKNK